ncbi:hypothetical protein AALP_AA6G361000 [Arabis alpina]|uniref:Uncharacterized protein n=1 Tax=Arabis alpina TaxID=50452 RepID=A0A087GTX7_ARAAL|nr:hypothetical protein AALP_AA6G361000 [Arabis alpina]
MMIDNRLMCAPLILTCTTADMPSILPHLCKRNFMVQMISPPEPPDPPDPPDPDLSCSFPTYDDYNHYTNTSFALPNPISASLPNMFRQDTLQYKGYVSLMGWTKVLSSSVLFLGRNNSGLIRFTNFSRELQTMRLE